MGPRGRAPTIAATGLAVLLLVACWVIVAPGSWGPMLTGDSLVVLAGAMAVACALYAAAKRDGALRQSWLLLAAMILLNTSGGAWWLLEGGTSETPRSASAADILFLLALVPALAGLVRYPMTEGLSRTWRPLLLDGLVLGSSMLLLSAVLGLSEVSRALEGSEAFVYLVYPVTDALVASLLVVVLLRSTGRLRIDVVLVAMTFGAFAVADLGFSLSSVRGVALSGVYQLGYVLAGVLLAGAALAAATLNTHRRVLQRDFSGPIATFLPDLAALGALALGLVKGINGPAEIVLVATLLSLTGLRQLTRTEHNRRMRRDLELRVAARTEEIRLITAEHRRLDAMKREFVSAVSHELRTPLTAIRGALELLAAGEAGDLPSSARPVVEMASRGSERLSRLVNDIIDLERLESGSFSLHPASHDLYPLLVDAAESLAPLARGAGVEVQVLPASVRVVCDGDRVTQALVNLLGNALKFTDRGGRVTLTAQELAHTLRVTVRDTGRGIPEDELTAIFDRFHQVDPDGTGQTTGTGLGLSITQRIVEAHGGRIWADSEPGHGSAFHFTLPMSVTGDGTGAAREVRPGVAALRG